MMLMLMMMMMLLLCDPSLLWLIQDTIPGFSVAFEGTHQLFGTIWSLHLTTALMMMMIITTTTAVVEFTRHENITDLLNT